MQTEQTRVIGQRIRHFRRLKKMTQFTLAEMLGKTKATIINWERGYFNILARDIPKVAECIGCTINDLYQ